MRDLAPATALARQIESQPEAPLDLHAFARAHRLSAASLRRRFIAAFGISPKLYQSGRRALAFRRLLADGASLINAGYAAGYGSTSRIYGLPASLLGMAPSRYRAGGAGEELSYALCAVADERLLMAASDQGVCVVSLGTDDAALVEELRREFPGAVLSVAPASQPLNLWIAALQAHLQHSAPRPELPLDLRGSAFQLKVWLYLCGLAPGATLSYRALAAAIGQPTAARAIAGACAANRVAVLVPCHRVLRSDGGLGGYRWGVHRKQRLLADEASSVHG